MKNLVYASLMLLFLASCSDETTNFADESQVESTNESYQDVGKQKLLIGKRGQYWDVVKRRSTDYHHQLKFRKLTTKKRPQTLHRGRGDGAWIYKNSVKWYYYTTGSGRSKKSYVSIGGWHYKVAYVSRTSLTLRRKNSNYSVYRFKAKF